jgi:hypothetical protein
MLVMRGFYRIDNPLVMSRRPLVIHRESGASSIHGACDICSVLLLDPL